MRWLLVLAIAACGSGSAGSSDGNGACPQTLVAFCATAPCPMTWTDAHDPRAWGCTGSLQVQLRDCGSVKTATRAGVDTGTQYDYDASGTLYRVERDSANFPPQCLAGSGDSQTCNDPNPQTINLCPP